MTSRFLEPLKASRNLMFVVIFFSSITYKVLFCWRSDIFDGWQDELVWKKLAATSSLTNTIFELDSGYPTPILRAISIILDNLSPSSFLVWHLFALFVIGLSLGSLAFSKTLSFEARVSIAGLLCVFPSFDLLLFHNIPYWVFIPLLLIFIDLIFTDLELSPMVVGAIFILIIMAAKPQLLVVFIFLLAVLFMVRYASRPQIIVLVILTLSLILIGRLSSSSIELNITFRAFLNFIVTINSHLFNVFLPLTLLSFFRGSKFLNIPLVITFYFLMTSAVSILIYYRLLKRSTVRWHLLLLFSILFVYSSSLYIFSNSGWSNPNLLSSYDSVSLFSRHYLPIVLIFGFIVSLGFRMKLSIWAFVLGITQNIVLQIILYARLYKAQ